MVTHTEKPTEELRNLVEIMAKALVDFPEQVNVAEIEGEQTTVIELKVAKEDLGKIIGKEGRTARSLRTILGAVSTKLRKRSVLEILE
ncbi:MAG: KH domain-containing protein [Proteobacteria bacterium]|nr:KH domain-containing protein [Pseudomonadota bacterium]NDC23546.1 KH domain-containing protein [Pseudomonadota bacterium]NDD03664.1 KH domain-containing protein [Pseudomonadota bacterium]NDG25839.1 KH domain-containing protein [Pseudomonadota bacterium]